MTDILYFQLDICDILQTLFKNDYIHFDINLDNITYIFENNEIKSYLIDYIKLNNINNKNYSNNTSYYTQFILNNDIYLQTYEDIKKCLFHSLY